MPASVGCVPRVADGVGSTTGITSACSQGGPHGKGPSPLTYNLSPEQLLAEAAKANLDVAQQGQLAHLIITAQVGSLLDQRIAQLAVGGQDPGAQSSVRKLIGVRYRQALAEYRMDLSEGSGIVQDATVKDFLNTRCLTIAGGTEQILLTLAAERLLGLPR